MILRSLAFVLVGLILADGALAQQKKKKKEDRKRGTLSGPIQAIAPDGSGIRFNHNSKPWLAVLTPAKAQRSGTIIEVHGFAVPAALSPGLFVSFETESDPSEELPPVEKLRIFSPQEGWQPGVRHEQTGLDDGRRFFISGQIARLKDNTVTINLGGGASLSVAVAEHAEITVFDDQLRLVMPGDQLEVSGIYYQEGEINANTIKVTLQKYVGPQGRRVDPPQPQPAAADPFQPDAGKAAPTKEEPKPAAEPDKPKPDPKPDKPAKEPKKPEPADSSDDEDDDEPGFLDFDDE